MNQQLALQVKPHVRRLLDRLTAIAIVVASCASAPSASAAVGATAGQFSVSAAGAATYTIPIFSPPGPRGLQPRIALAYNSTSGIGPAGKGWTISGISQIYRCSKTSAQDAEAAPVSL